MRGDVAFNGVTSAQYVTFPIRLTVGVVHVVTRVADSRDGNCRPRNRPFGELAKPPVRRGRHHAFSVPDVATYSGSCWRPEM